MLIYNTTDSNNHTLQANYERGFARWINNNFVVGTERGGTGQARQVAIMASGDYRVWIDGTAMIPNSVNTYDLGKLGGNVWRNLHLGTGITINSIPQSKVVATVALTNQTGSITATPLFTPDALHKYRVSVWYETVSTTATGGSVGTVGITCNTGVRDQGFTIGSSVDAATVKYIRQTDYMMAGPSKPFSYSFGYAATGGTVIYNLYITIEQLQ